MAAHEAILEDVPGAGLLAITSPGSAVPRLAGVAGAPESRAIAEAAAGAAASGRRAGYRHRRPPGDAVVARRGRRATRIVPLGVDRFGQSGDIPDLYREYGIDADAIVDAAARACLRADRAI